jgi:hypothetical protein
LSTSENEYRGRGSTEVGELTHTLFSLSTTSHPSISRPALEACEHETERFVLSPRCFSRALCLWPWRTASVVPMIAGQAAMAVRIPSTIADDYDKLMLKQRI